MSLNVVAFPDQVAALDIPAALRNLADQIESGDHGSPNSLLWVVDAGMGEIKLGLLGKVGDISGTAFILAAAAQKRILAGVAE